MAVRQTPFDDQSISENKPCISLKWKAFSFEALSLAHLSLDGKDVTELVGRQSDGISFTPNDPLRDGMHIVTVRLRYKFLFTKVVKLEWAFDVDTKKPYIELGDKGVLGSRDFKTEVSGLTEPASKVQVKLNGKRLANPAVYGGGTFFIGLNLAPDDNTLELEVTDRAGNKDQKSLAVVIDREPPAISGYFPNDKKKVKISNPVIEAVVQEEESNVKTVDFKVNGLKLKGQYDSSLKKIWLNHSGLAEGNNSVEVEVKDAAGNLTSASWSFLVDSTEEFGKQFLKEGASGADVKELQARLFAQGFNCGKMAAKFDSGTVQAVRAFQEANKIPVTGMVGSEELRILKPQKLDTSKPIQDAHILIYLSRRGLMLYSSDRLVKTYPIAVGRGGRFKSPVGKHVIRKKIVNPTWYPPEWAGLTHAIPPGPNNPLGNREMKLSKKGYSIHGTNRPMSVGTPATHGCIRMYPSDVLELFDVVNVGTPVEIRL